MDPDRKVTRGGRRAPRGKQLIARDGKMTGGTLCQSIVARYDVARWVSCRQYPNNRSGWSIVVDGQITDGDRHASLCVSFVDSAVRS